MGCWWLILVGSFVLFVAGSAVAQKAEDVATEDVTMSRVADTPVLGWQHKFSTTAGMNVLENKNVVGQDDGVANTYSLKLSALTKNVTADSDFETTLEIQQSYTKTPTLDRLVKSKDSLDLISMYKHYLPTVKWLGGFARFELNTPLQRGYSEQAEDKDFVIAPLADSEDPVKTKTTDRLKLTNGFQPLTMKESLGAVFQILRKKNTNLEFRAGLGAKQIYAEGGLYVDDDDETDPIEVFTFNDVEIFGTQVAIEWKGSTGVLEYKLVAEALTPLDYSPKGEDDPEEIKLTSTDISADLAYKVVEWLAINYNFSAKRDPLLQPEAQVSHNFLLTISYNYDSLKPVKK